MALSVLICVLLAILFQTGEQASIRPAQSIGVSGKLLCKGSPASNVLVKLYDHDTFTIDDKIASGRTDGSGNFLISGQANEVTSITPKFNIYHDCDDWLPCQRKVSIYIPKSYVTAGSSANKIYDAGTLELSGKFQGESRDCLH
ncbi:transthyretin-like family domain-containing protein [Ditylenchus destructor]|nr:transthyretin-like family domain-containing protein [Ditylenchus destructor]